MSSTVRVGQVWADNDKRANNRMVRVVELTDTHAIVELVTARAVPTLSGLKATARFGRQTRIRLDRFKPTSTGYRLVQDAPASCCDVPSAAPCDLDDCPGTRKEAHDA